MRNPARRTSVRFFRPTGFAIYEHMFLSLEKRTGRAIAAGLDIAIDFATLGEYRVITDAAPAADSHAPPHLMSCGPPRSSGRRRPRARAQPAACRAHATAPGRARESAPEPHDGSALDPRIRDSAAGRDHVHGPHATAGAPARLGCGVVAPGAGIATRGRALPAAFGAPTALPRSLSAMRDRILAASALLGIVAGIVLKLAGQDTAADVAWAAVIVLLLIPLTWEVVVTVARGRVGVDAIALMAMATALAMQEYLAGAVVGVDAQRRQRARRLGGRPLEARAARTARASAARRPPSRERSDRRGRRRRDRCPATRSSCAPAR